LQLVETEILRRKRHLQLKEKKSGSQFWKGIMSVREDVARGLVYIIGNGKRQGVGEFGKNLTPSKLWVFRNS
jgi:hypothetical protein